MSTNHDKEDPELRLAESKRIQREFLERELDLRNENPNTQTVIPSDVLDLATAQSSGSASGSTSGSSDRPPLPFKTDAQSIYLLNIAHVNQHPHCSVPAFRILGGFSSSEDAQAFVQQVGVQSYGGAAIHMTEAHKKTLLCSSLKRQQNPEYVMHKIEATTKRYIDMLNRNKSEFLHNYKNKKQGKVERPSNNTSSDDTKTTSYQVLKNKKIKELEKKSKRIPNVLSRQVEVRGQRFAVISIMEDNDPCVLKGMDENEPIIIIWQCFDTEDDAKHYIKNTAKEKVTSLHMDIYNMYEWIYPTLLNPDQVQEDYRNDRLDKIMKSRKSNRKQVMQFEEFCQSVGQETPTIEFDVTDEKHTKITTPSASTMNVSCSLRGLNDRVETKEETPGVVTVETIPEDTTSETAIPETASETTSETASSNTTSEG